MPQLEFATFASQLFWLAITFITLYIIMDKMALPGVRQVLQLRQDKLSSDLSQAESLKNQAKKAEDEYNTVLAEARERASASIEEARAVIAQQEAERNAKLEENFAKQKKEVETRVNNIRKEASEKLAPISIEVAKNILKKTINQDIDDKKIKDVVSEISGLPTNTKVSS